MGLTDASDSRLADLTRWVFEDLGFAGSRIAPASADASFRRYFRVTRGTDTFIVMDAPPEKEDIAPFLSVGRALLGLGLNAPVTLARNMEQGFLLLSDLGNRQYLDELAADDEPAATGTADRLYADAMAALCTLHTAGGAAARELPPYGRDLLMREMELLPEWFLHAHLRMPPSAAERAMLDGLFAALAQCALTQPAVFVHRDYHSRNLLVCPDANPGILDFQDAVRGPVTYDLASLLKDCYISWPRPRVRAWALGYRERMLAQGFALNATESRIHALVRSYGLAAAHQGIGHFCAPVLSRRQAAIPEGFAARARLRAGGGGGLCGDGAVRRVHRAAHRA